MKKKKNKQQLPLFYLPVCGFNAPNTAGKMLLKAFVESVKAELEAGK